MSTRPASATTSSTTAAKKTVGSASARANAVSAPSGAKPRVPISSAPVGARTTTVKKTTVAPVPAKGSKPQAITKRNVVEAVKTTTTTTTTSSVVVENGNGVISGDALLLNGDAPSKDLLMTNGNGESHVNGNGYGEAEKEGVVGAEGQKMVIDLTAD